MRATCCLLALSVAVLLLAAYVSAAPTGYCDDSTVYCGSANYRTGNCTCNFDCNCLSGRDHTDVYPGTCRVSSVAVCSDPGPISATETGLGSTAVLGFNPVPGSLTLTKGGKNVALKVRGEAVRGRSGFDINWVSNLLSPDRTACATHGMEPYLCGTTQSVAQGCSALTDSTTCESKLGCQWSQSVCSSSYTYQHATVSNTSQVAFSCETGSNANYAIESTLNTAQRVIRIQQSQVGSPRPLGHHFVCTGNPGTNNRLYCPTATSCPLSMKSGARPSVEPERWNWVCPENPTCPPPSLPGYSNPWTVDTHQSFNFYQCPPGGITLNPAVYQPASGDPCSQTIACGQAVTSPAVAADDCPIGWWCQAAGFETPKCPPEGPTWTQITKKREARAVGDYYCPAGARITIDNLQYYVDLNQATESDGTYACRGDTDGEFRCPDGQTGCPQWRKADGTIVQITCDLSSYPLSNGPNLCPPRSVTYQAHEDKPTQGMPETVVIRLKDDGGSAEDTVYSFDFGPSGVVSSSASLCETACGGTCPFTEDDAAWTAEDDMTWVTNDPGSSGYYLALFDLPPGSAVTGALTAATKRLAVIMNADQAITAVYEETGTWAATTLAEFTDTTKGAKRCTGGALYLSGQQRVFRFEGCKTSTGYTCGNPIELRSVNPDFLAGSYAWDDDIDAASDPVGCQAACGNSEPCNADMSETSVTCTGSVDVGGTAVVYTCTATGRSDAAFTFDHDYVSGDLTAGDAGSNSMCDLNPATSGGTGMAVGKSDLNKIALGTTGCFDAASTPAACTTSPFLSPVVSTVVRSKVRATEKLVRVTPVHHSRKVTDPTVYTCGNAPTGSVFGVPADLANPNTAASARLYFPPTVPETREYYEAPASSLTSVPEDFYPCNQGPVYCFGFQPDGWHTEEYTPAPTAAGSAPQPEAWCPPMSVHRTDGTAGTPAEAFVNSPEGWSDGDSTCWDELSIDVPWNQAVAKDCCRRTEEACVNQGATVTCARYDCTPEVCAIDQLPEAWGPPASFTRTRSVCQDLPISILYTITFVDASVTFTANIRGNSECFVVRMFYDDVDRRFVVVTECRVDNPFRLDEPFTQVNDGQTPLGVLKLPQSVPQGSPNEVSPAGTYHFGHTNTFGNTLPTVPGQTSYNFATSNCPTTLDATPEEKCIHTTTIFFDSPPGGWGVYCTTGFASDPANPPQAPWLITWGGDYLCKDTLLPPSVQRPCGGISVPPAPAQFEVEVNNVDFCAEVFQVQFTVDITLHDPVSDLQLQGDLTTGEDYIARVKIVPIAGQEDATTFLATSNITKVVLQGDIVNGDPGYELTLHDVNAITPPQPPVSTAIRWFRTRVTEEDTSGGVRRSVLYLEYQFNVSPGVFFLVNSQPGPGILYRFLVSGDVHHLGSQPQKRITPVRAISNSRQGTNVDPFFEEAEFTIPDGTTGGPQGPIDNGSSSSGLSGLEIGLIAAGVGVVAIGAAVLVVAAMLRKKNMASQWTKSSVMI